MDPLQILYKCLGIAVVILSLSAGISIAIASWGSGETERKAMELDYEQVDGDWKPIERVEREE